MKTGFALVMAAAPLFALACDAANPSANPAASDPDGQSAGDARQAVDGEQIDTDAKRDAESGPSEDARPGDPPDLAGAVDARTVGDALAAGDGLIATDGATSADAARSDAAPTRDLGPTADALPSPDMGPETADAATSTADAHVPVPCVEGDVRPCDDLCLGGVVTCTAGEWGACVGPIEVCNDADDDCDGEIDEDFLCLNAPCWVGVGACARVGRQACDDTGDDTRCDAAPGEPAAETCNGRDDDCDGETDEGFDVGGPCDVGLGECRAQGTLICAGDGTATCDAEPGFPGAERCNGLDDNCDGQTDEGFDLGVRCTVGVGLCEAVGRRVCGPQGNAVCGARAGEPLPEQCNGLDDNCDGQVDEGFPTLGSACAVGQGACERRGQLVCNDAADGVRCDAVAAPPALENCNGIDDDCDGVVDDGFDLGAACAVGLGACRSNGATVCLPDGRAACDAHPGLPEAEICNGVDDDCDGLVDEDAAGAPLESVCFDGPAGAVNVGTCRSGRALCENGQLSACRQQELPVAELCDTLDNDCDGTADDGVPGVGGACGTGRLGACASGHLLCTLGGQFCAPDAQPTLETCNDVDDDCDGQIDNGTGRGDACAVGVGECRRGGRLVCTANGGTVCDALAGAPAADDTCDGLDNDCDGRLDEDVPDLGTACQTGLGGACAPGHLACGVGALVCQGDAAAGAESCDGVDNDCNGVVDNGCPVAITTGAPVDGPEIAQSYSADDYRVNCPVGMTLTGMTVSRGLQSAGYFYNYVNGIQLTCRQVSLVENAAAVPHTYSVSVGVQFLPAFFGHGSNTQEALDCPAGQVLTGVSGAAGANVYSLRGTCATVAVVTRAGVSSVATAFAGQTASSFQYQRGAPFQYACAGDTVLSGVHGDLDMYGLQSIGFICSPLILQTR